ncbi:uncharacterized protein [Procambarus clarkii]|uniref:uncharacterized protein n=1 Tax=Procambarus clarkii TaxID=6728 RepID=UPI00374204AF
MMKVLRCVVVTAALLVLVLVDGGVAGDHWCPDPSSPSVMTVLTEDLCERADKSACEAYMVTCLHHPATMSHSDHATWREHTLVNATDCARELGYTFTSPTTDNMSIWNNESSSAEPCHHLYGLENLLIKLKFTTDELLPMIRCLMTRNEKLENFRTCINKQESQ